MSTTSSAPPKSGSGKVIALCGKICCGKSRYAAKLRESENAVVFSTDEVTFDLLDNEQGAFYDSICPKIQAYLLKKAAECAATGITAVLDWGFWSWNERAKTSAYFRSRGVKIEWRYLKISDADWERNIAERNAQIAAGGETRHADFFVDEGLKQKVLSLWQEPDKNEIDVLIEFRRDA